MPCMSLAVVAHRDVWRICIALILTRVLGKPCRYQICAQEVDQILPLLGATASTSTATRRKHYDCRFGLDLPEKKPTMDKSMTSTRVYGRTMPCLKRYDLAVFVCREHWEMVESSFLVAKLTRRIEAMKGRVGFVAMSWSCRRQGQVVVLVEPH